MCRARVLRFTSTTNRLNGQSGTGLSRRNSVSKTPDFKKSIAISGEFIRQHSKKRQDKGTSAALDLGACDTGSSFRVENRPSNVRWRKPQRWRVGMEYLCPMVLRYRISPANRWRCSTLG